MFNLISLVAEAATETALEHAPEIADDSGGVIGTLGLNWKLFLAQLVNFLVILFVLWRWVFKPVGGALESRRQKIEASVRSAEAIEKRLQETDLEREEKLAAAAATAEQIIKRTSVETEKSKQEALLAARAEAERVISQAREMIRSEKQQMLTEIKEEVAGLVVMATEKILHEKLDEKKDKELIQNVLREIK